MFCCLWFVVVFCLLDLVFDWTLLCWFVFYCWCVYTLVYYFTWLCIGLNLDIFVNFGFFGCIVLLTVMLFTDSFECILLFEFVVTLLLWLVWMLMLLLGVWLITDLFVVFVFDFCLFLNFGFAGLNCLFCCCDDFCLLCYVVTLLCDCVWLFCLILLVCWLINWRFTCVLGWLIQLLVLFCLSACCAVCTHCLCFLLLVDCCFALSVFVFVGCCYCWWFLFSCDWLVFVSMLYLCVVLI